MPNPVNIRFWQDNTDEHPLSLYLYWKGTAYAHDLAVALASAEHRWNDPEYATRIAIQSILQGRFIGPNDLGAGLYVGTEDHGGVVINVNWGSKTVWNDRWRLPFENYINGEWKTRQ